MSEAELAEVRRLRDIVRHAKLLLAAWRNGDEPEGAPSARRTLLAIAELLEL